MRFNLHIYLLTSLLFVPNLCFGADPFQDHYDQAVSAYKRGDYETAITHFQRAYDLRSLPRLLVNLGRAHLKLRHGAQAATFLSLYLRTEKGIPQALRLEIERDLEIAKQISEPTPKEEEPETTPPKTHLPQDPAPSADPDSFQVHFDRGNNYFMRDRHTEALHEWELAYAKRKMAILLYRQGQAHLRLGNRDAALACYLRYLESNEAQDPRLVADAKAQIRWIRQNTEGEPAASGPALSVQDQLTARPVQAERNVGLLATGISLWASAYIPAVVVGLTYGGYYSETYGAPAIGAIHDPKTDAAFYPLLIPIAGPFLSAVIFPFRVTPKQASDTVAWSLSWTLVDGAAQIAGLAMLVSGVRKKQPPSWTLAPLRVPQGHGVSLAGSF